MFEKEKVFEITYKHGKVSHLYTLNDASYSMDGGFYKLANPFNVDTPDVICLCGNYKFLIKYGQYEVNCVCLECNRKFNIYS